MGGAQTRDVRLTCEANDSPSNLEGGEIENYGTDGAASGYLLNREGSAIMGKISDPSEIEACEVSRKGGGLMR